MKKVLLAVLLCGVVGVVAQAESVFSEYQGRYGADITQAVKNASVILDEKATLSALTVGDFLFALDTEEEVEYAAGKTKKVYTYYPQRKPAVFRETVSIDIHNGEAKLISERATINRIIGPLEWKYTNYEISSIEITIYPRDVLRSLYLSWRSYFGQDCVSLYRKFPFNGSYAAALHTPLAAFNTKDGRAVEVVAYASSDEFGPYRRECAVKAPGVLYKKFMKMVEKLKRDLSR